MQGRVDELSTCGWRIFLPLICESAQRQDMANPLFSPNGRDAFQVPQITRIQQPAGCHSTKEITPPIFFYDIWLQPLGMEIHRWPTNRFGAKRAPCSNR